MFNSENSNKKMHRRFGKVNVILLKAEYQANFKCSDSDSICKGVAAAAVSGGA